MSSDNDILLTIAKDIAINTEATKNIDKQVGEVKDHLKTLNGKVAAQESTTSTLKNAVDILIEKDRRKSDNNSRLTWLTIENIFKLVFAIAIAYLLYQAGLQ